MSRLRIMHGFPLSGKSTDADKMREDEGWVIVCPDDFRAAMYGEEFIGKLEVLLWANVEIAVKALLSRGHNVIVDATNLTKWSRKFWITVAEQEGALFDVRVMLTPPSVCEERAIKDGKPHMVEVIRRMQETYEGVDSSEWRANE